MERNTISVQGVRLITVAVCLAATLLGTTVASADNSDPGRLRVDGDKPTTTVEAKVESRSDGVYIQISVRQTVPGTSDSASSVQPVSQSTDGQGNTSGNSSFSSSGTTSSNSGGSSGGASTPGRSWTDQTGYHWEGPTGQVITATPPNIGAATRQMWSELFQQHTNQNPYLVYVDQQFSGIIWVPQSSGSQNVTVVGTPGSPSQQPMPSGNGSSTDPREVALDALGHQPLPNVQIRMNPALGLVAMPAWFWVDGYDGSAFGTSRTVEIPPEVGSDVPVSVVPANDPRRQGSSFTVEVRIWPSRYQWGFGDGASMVSQTLGRQYPAQSDIQHTYEFSSLQFAGGFPVTLTVDFSAEYRVNGGPPQGLPTIQHTYENDYRVQEAQSVLASR